MHRIWLFLSCILLSLFVAAQSAKKFDIEVENLPLPQVFDSISAKTSYFFSYNSQILPKGSLYSLSRQNTTIKKYLDELFVGTGITYTFYDDQIILKRDPQLSTFSQGDVFMITGITTDKATGETLPGVNVYLDGTTYGAATDVDGRYQLEDIPIGSHEIVFSSVGYKKVIYSFTVDRTGKMVVNAIMEEDLLELDEITIYADSAVGKIQDEALFARFRKEMLGSTSNAVQCEIINPDVLNFSYDSAASTMKVINEQPLRIRNEALGYEIQYDIELFESSQDKIRSFANLRFEKLEHDRRREKRKWRRNRDVAYHGSIRHFLKSLVEDNFKSEGFRMYDVESIQRLSDENLIPLEREEVIRPTDDPLKFEIYFTDYIYVIYDGEVESSAYRSDMERRIYSSEQFDLQAFLFAANKTAQNQRSVFKVIEEPTEIDLNGHIVKPLSVSTNGYWAWEKLADMVPIDYKRK